MPFKRKYFKRRWKRNRYGIRKLRNQVKAISARDELKYIDIEELYFQPNYPATGNIAVCLNTCTQGTTVNTRIANRIRQKRLMIRGHIDNSAGTTPEDCIIRLIVFRAKQSNNAQMNWGLLMQDVNYFHSMRRMEHKRRFKVYFDQTFTMKASTDASAQSTLPFKINIPLKNTVVYNGNAGTYADIERNSLWMIAVTSVATAANNPYIYYSSRVTFYDS